MEMTHKKPSRAVKEMTDDELFDEMRDQVNKARNNPDQYDREMMRAIAKEMKKRDWRNH